MFDEQATSCAPVLTYSWSVLGSWQHWLHGHPHSALVCRVQIQPGIWPMPSPLLCKSTCRPCPVPLCIPCRISSLPCSPCTPLQNPSPSLLWTPIGLHRLPAPHAPLVWFQPFSAVHPLKGPNSCKNPNYHLPTFSLVSVSGIAGTRVRIHWSWKIEGV